MRLLNFKVLLVGLAILGIFADSCSNDSSKKNNVPSTTASPAISSTSSYDPKRGEGKFDATNLIISNAVDESMASKGEAIAKIKCMACHKLTDERLVGPGWKGVTTKRTPYWIMNFITNPDPMIEKDPEVQAQLELCLVRMPNQNLTEDDARQILEFMRKNDSSK